jgi:hypothetical protein
VQYFDVTSDADQLKTMLKYSEGVRKVPVIVDRKNVIVGFNGGT